MTAIDPSTGVLTFDDGFAIGPHLERPSASLVTLAPRLLDGVLYSATLWLEGEDLRSVSLYPHEVGESTSWDDWSLEREQAVQSRNEAWLLRVLGPPHESYARTPYPDGKIYRYAWGTIDSSYSPQTPATSLVITYARAMR